MTEKPRTAAGTESVADLMLLSEPDNVLPDMRRAEFLEMTHDGPYSAPMATFTGVGYALGVWLCADLSTYAVAPLWVGGPPAALRRADIHLFSSRSTADVGRTYARACLFALRDTAESLESEVQG